MVANLPYGVAATVLLKSIEELPDATLWVAMVQREVGERLAAAPGSKTYGATSVLAQLACEVKVVRRVPRTVFHPVPNVDSALVRPAPARRRAPDAGVRALVHAGFAHRRKALAGSLALAPDAPRTSATRARAALEQIGQPADARAERLAPADFRLARSAERSAASAMIRERAPAKVNLVLHVGPPARRRPARALLALRLARAGRRADAESSETRRGRGASAPAWRARTSRRRRSRLSASA